MVLIHPWNVHTCYVKERDYFLSLGRWKGRCCWKKISATSIEDARRRGLEKYWMGTYK
jgi:hypothetical protein